MFARLWKERLTEYLRMDSWLVARLIAFGGLCLGGVCWFVGRDSLALRYLTRVHRGDHSPMADRLIEWFLRKPDSGTVASPRHQRLKTALEAHIARYPRAEGVVSLFDNPAAMLNSRAVVLKSPGVNEKGVLLIDYNFALPLFARFFDIPKITRLYRLVIEPSWSGYCDPDILCYTTFDFKVVVEAFEPRDSQFVVRAGSNLIPVPVSTNWWVDHRVFRPLPDVNKDTDLIMVASWAPFKRHARFFAALSRLAARGHRPSVLLVGYPYQTTREQILRQARYYHVDNQIEVKENLTPEAVNVEFNRAKVNVIWSRREGVNRAIIEGMFAQVPCILREGFNYNYRYPYVNEHTGCYATEDSLPDRLLEMIRRSEDLRPRDWVLGNMTCQSATKAVAEALRKEAGAAGEAWTNDLAVKVGGLASMRYWNESDGARFVADYDYLRTCLKP